MQNSEDLESQYVVECRQELIGQHGKKQFNQN